jgi:hypothetical protein
MAEGDAEIDRSLLAGPPWGYWRGDTFALLPKPPLVMAGLGRPPFDVTLPSGEVRHVLEQPVELRAPDV